MQRVKLKKKNLKNLVKTNVHVAHL